jgi:hypothetical protein
VLAGATGLSGPRDTGPSQHHDVDHESNPSDPIIVAPTDTSTVQYCVSGVGTSASNASHLGFPISLAWHLLGDLMHYSIKILEPITFSISFYNTERSWHMAIEFCKRRARPYGC